MRVGVFLLLALVSLSMAVPDSARAMDFACSFTGDDNYQMDNPGNIESVFPAVKQWEDKRGKNLNDTTGFYDGPADLPLDPNNYTMYELAGVRGLNWSMTMRGLGDASQDKGFLGMNANGADNCSVMNFINNGLADTVFDLTKLLTRASISIKEYASNPSPLSGLYEGRNSAVEALKKNLFIPAVPVLITLTGIWVYGKWRKNEMREAWSGVGWAALTTVAVVVMLTGGNYQKVINEADAGIAQANSLLSEAVLSGLSGTMQPPCDLPENARNRGVRVNSCAMYDTLLFRPWALGQFGEPGTDCIFKKDKGEVRGGECIPKGSGGSCYWGTAGSARCEDLRVRQLVSQARTNKEIGKDLDKYKNDWIPIRYEMAGGKGANHDKGDYFIYPVSFNEWAGHNAGDRLGIAFYSVIASFIVGVMVIVLSALTLLWHAVTLIMIIMLPLIATLGIHPSQQKLLKGWLETFIHSFVLRAGFGVILTVLLVLYQMILPARISLGMQLLMLLLVTIAVVMMLKKLLSGAYSPKIAGAEDALGVGDMANSLSSKIGAQGQRLAGNLAGNAAAGVAKAPGRVAGRAASGVGWAAGRAAGNAGRGLDKVALGGRLQKGGWIAPSNTKRDQRKSAAKAAEVQNHNYERMKEDQAERAERQSAAEPEPRRRSGRVSASNPPAPQQGPPPAPQPAPAPAPQQAPVPQQAPRPAGRVSIVDGPVARPPAPRPPQAPTPPAQPRQQPQPYQSPPPRDGSGGRISQ
ncbi:hypothetical protein ACIGD1_06425 [Streptomyces sp. NPDC085612]|uniref:hypothetical protein n=1 Tax=Streptomyces sp. NPDC085612 TaxID=3365732 RepID=UPI0037D74D1B